MFNRTKEVPKYQQIHSGLYKFELPYITGLFKSMEPNEDKVREVQRFPVEVYVLNDKDIAARFVMYGNDTLSVGDRYAQLATILRKAYFTALFTPDVPGKIKWIEHRNAKNTVRNREEILEIELKWDEKLASYSILGHSLLNSIFD
ncbi:hypothetical protein [Bacillus wiedmannii]|uniref:Uncharacterized protein n=2 Tax=Bacillus wiedmannii TaxID=1890302 RepID=A0A242Z0T9_9BACI|nr:hypothetical protein [Bacillus wiedmannii]MED3126846.1 hypothetical protein [Bacillus wiedmannii]OTX86052.1 hypothetical protein BK730_21980 [Bacillus wiedmannii]